MTKEEIKRKIIELKDDEEILEFIKSRIMELESTAQEKTVGQGYTATFDDYISSKVNYKPAASIPNSECPNLIFDDPQPYFELIKEIKDSGYNELSILGPIMFEVFNYMSSEESKENDISTTNDRSMLYYSAMKKGIKNISIKEFHDNKCALCSENAGLAHNIFKLLGIDSEVVIGKRNTEPHAYNFIFPRGYNSGPVILFDPSFVINFKNNKGDFYGFGYFKVLTTEEYNNLISGNDVYINLDETVNKLYNSNVETLSGFVPKYENANYSVDIKLQLKRSNGSR